MKWDEIGFEDKCRILGDKGEKFVYDKLIKNYPQDRFLILDLHEFCEMDWVIIDKSKNKIIKVYEVKTTTKDYKEFKAGSHFQLAAFELQKIKKRKGKEYVPCFLWVLRADKKFWRDGELEVISEEIYTLDEIKTDFKNCKWALNLI